MNRCNSCHQTCLLHFLRLLALVSLCFCLFFPGTSHSLTLVQKRQFLFPNYLLKADIQREAKPIIRTDDNTAAAVAAPPMTMQMDGGGLQGRQVVLDPVMPVVNVFPIRRGPQQKEFAMRPCYFSPIQCLLHTPEHDRLFANYPEFQQQQAGSNNNGNFQQQQQLNAARVKAAVEALAVQSQMLERKAKARRMQRQSPPSTEADGVLLEAPMQAVAASTAQQQSRHRLFGNPWRRGL